METLWQDLRYGARQMLRNPGFTLVTVLTLALGIGVNTAIFSVVNSVLLQPLPYGNGARLVRLGYRPPGPGRQVGFSVLELDDIRRQNRTLERLAEYHSMDFNLVGKGEPDQVATGVVSANWFDGFGIKPLQGRTFRADDEMPGAPPVLLLTYDFWQRRFGGDPGIIGQTLRMNDRPITVIGVLPRLPQYPGKDDVFMPTSACPFRSGETVKNSRNIRMLSLFGQTRPGLSLQQAQADVSTISGRLEREYPDAYREAKSSDLFVASLHEELTSGFRPTLLILLGIVGLVLLIACANVATMSLARMISREQEVVVRVALGAGRPRLIRQLLTESLLLSLLGGVLGLVIAASAMKLMVAFADRFTARATEIHIDALVLLFTLGVSLGTGLLFGAIPAFQSARRNLAISLREAAGRATGNSAKHAMRSALIVAQVALSFILLMGAGLSIRSSIKLQQVNPGFDPQNVLVATLSLPFSKYQSPQSLFAFYEPLLSRVQAYPGVIAASLAGDVPLEGNPRTPTFKIEGSETDPGLEQPKAALHVASADYFRTLGTPILAGRSFLSTDTATAPQVVIVNKALADRYFPGQDPIGKRIALTSFGDDSWNMIVGVAGDVRQESLTAEASPALYFAFDQAAGRIMRLMVRTSGSPEAMASIIRGVVHNLDPEQPVADLRTLEEVRSVSMAPSRLTTTLLALFAALAFAITVIGITGVVAFSVTERTQEIGIRSALGAGRREVLELVLRQSLVLVAIGLTIGAAAALFLTRLLSSVLFGVEPNDPLTFVLVALMLAAVVSVACLMPARRALSIDPIVALRSG